MSEPEPERRRWPPLLWAAIALPLWAAVAILPAGIMRAVAGDPNPAQLSVFSLAFGMCAAAAFLVAVDRRIGPPGQPAWVPVQSWTIGAAFVAGLGAAILASELHNVVQAMVGAPLNDPNAPTVTPASMAVLGLVQPACLVIVLQGVVQRSFAARLSAGWAIVATLAIGAFFGGSATTRIVPLLVLPGWLFARGKSLLPAIAALMPVGITTALNALDLGPGIAGFDRTGPDAQWQPIWFNALGAGLLAVGMQPLLKAWSPR